MDDAKRAGSSVELAALRQELEDRAGMALALALAEEAERADEVPIGAVVVRDGVLLGAAFPTVRSNSHHFLPRLAIILSQGMNCADAGQVYAGCG